MMAFCGAVGQQIVRLRVQAPLKSQHARHRPAARRLVTASSLKVRPYTVRKGDTLASIAKKRDVEISELVKLNHDVAPEALVEGQTLLLPAGKLSARDKEILAGIGPWTYRTYPVRAGENIVDIISKRGITRKEMEELNPGVDLDHLSANQVLKLPANKYTTREKEMLSDVVPLEFFNAAGINKTSATLLVMLLGCAVYIWRQKRDDDE